MLLFGNVPLLNRKVCLSFWMCLFFFKNKVEALKKVYLKIRPSLGNGRTIKTFFILSSTKTPHLSWLHYLQVLKSPSSFLTKVETHKIQGPRFTGYLPTTLHSIFSWQIQAEWLCWHVHAWPCLRRVWPHAPKQLHCWLVYWCTLPVHFPLLYYNWQMKYNPIHPWTLSLLLSWLRWKLFWKLFRNFFQKLFPSNVLTVQIYHFQPKS